MWFHIRGSIALLGKKDKPELHFPSEAAPLSAAQYVAQKTGLVLTFLVLQSTEVGLLLQRLEPVSGVARVPQGDLQCDCLVGQPAGGPSPLRCHFTNIMLSAVLYFSLLCIATLYSMLYLSIYLSIYVTLFDVVFAQTITVMVSMYR